jgi:hypothetical protein
VRGRLLVAAIVCGALALPAQASAASDFAYGAGIGSWEYPFAFSARSAPDGTGASGRAILGGFFGDSEGPVTCLRVVGDAAVFGARIERSADPSLVGKGFVGHVQDGGGFDTAVVAQAPTTCPAVDPAQPDPAYGQLRVGDDSDLPPPPADPTWSVSKAAQPPFRYLNDITYAAMRITDGSAIGYAALKGTDPETGEPRSMYGNVVCLDVDGRIALTGIEKDRNRSRILENAAQIASIDGPDQLSVGLVPYPGDSGEVECAPPYPSLADLTSGSVNNRAGEPLPPAPVRCGATIREDTTLQGDLNCDGIYGIRIGAPGITLDLAGHSITAHSVSILNRGYDNVTIRNGSVGVDTRGIVLEGVTGNLIRDVSLSGLINGIELTGSDDNRIVANDLLSVGLEIRNGSDGNVIRNNTLRGFEGYLWILNSTRNRVVDNLSRTSRETGIRLVNAAQSLISQNDITAVNGRGVGLSGSSSNTVADNVVHAEPNGSNPVAVEGVTLTDSDTNLILRNTILDATTAVRIVSGAGNEARRNQGLRGLADGFIVESAATGTTLRLNYAFDFGGDGFDVQAPGTRLGDNRADSNGGLGIRAVPGVIDLGGNQAAGNGDPAQCLNVACN